MVAIVHMCVLVVSIILVLGVAHAMMELVAMVVAPVTKDFLVKVVKNVHQGSMEMTARSVVIVVIMDLAKIQNMVMEAATATKVGLDIIVKNVIQDIGVLIAIKLVQMAMGIIISVMDMEHVTMVEMEMAHVHVI